MTLAVGTTLGAHAVTAKLGEGGMGELYRAHDTLNANSRDASVAITLLAETNLAWMRYSLDDPRMAGMREEIDRINALGDRSPGCVWRFKTTGGDATDVRVLGDWRVLFNLTLWRTLDDLRRYVYHSEHAGFLRRRREWFLRPPREPVALWWISEGPYPSVDEALARLERLWQQGPSAGAFTLKRPYSSDGRPLGSAQGRTSVPAN